MLRRQKYLVERWLPFEAFKNISRKGFWSNTGFTYIDLRTHQGHVLANGLAAVEQVVVHHHVTLNPKERRNHEKVIAISLIPLRSRSPRLVKISEAYQTVSASHELTRHQQEQPHREGLQG